MTNIQWQQIETVILDLDGTLIDLYFDHYFWKYAVPLTYAHRLSISVEESSQRLKQQYDAIEHSMDWYCLDFWEKTLALPLRQLLQAQAPFVKVRSDAIAFLTALRQKNKQLILLTDSHPFSLKLKLMNCELAQYFDFCLSSHQFNAPKVEQILWHRLQAEYPFDPSKTLMIDDTEKVLDSAKQFGIAYTLGIENPDSSLADKCFARHIGIKDYRTLLDINS